MTLSSGLTLPVEKLSEICRKYQVRELSVFGSAARGDMRPDSDIDLLVEFEPDARIGLFKFAGLEHEFSDLLGRKVDLVSKLGLKPWIRPHVLRDAKVLYAA
jgi:predicted nucleotidyltransferase